MAETRGKPLKIGVAVVLLVVAGWFVYQNTRPSGIFPSERMFVCVATGKLFAIPNEGKVRVYPLENPETKQNTLFPCTRHEDGSYYVSSRWREGVKALGEVNQAVDPDTLKVKDAKP